MEISEELKGFREIWESERCKELFSFLVPFDNIKLIGCLGHA
jgi:hypothetical protein